MDPDMFLRSICDKKSFDALTILESVNPEKCSKMKEKVKKEFQRSGKMLDFERYREIAMELEEDKNISVLRKNRCQMYDLDEIDDLE